ncbi:sensor histidine kinase [Sulfurimonas sp.]
MDKYAQKLRAIMDLQDDIILTTDGEHLEYVNKAFFKFSKFKNFEEFKNFHECVCELFVQKEGDNYLKPTYDEGNWISHLRKNPNKEFFVVIKSFKGIDTFFKVNFKKIDNVSKSYMISLHDATSYKENLDLIHLISNIKGVYFSLANMYGEIIKISQSLLEVLQIEDFTEKKYAISDFLNEEDKKLTMQHIASNDSSPYEVTIRYGEHVIPIMVQGYFGVMNNIPIRIAVLIDLRELKQLQVEAKQRDIVLFQQAKMAQMGEMINMIAHQWRQPLSAISAASIKAVMKKQLGQLKEKEFYKTQNFIQEQCQKMSKVINTFMEYSKATQKTEIFLFSDIFNVILDLVNVQFNAHNIKIDIKYENLFKIKGSKDMLEQVVLNLLMNARDAYNEKKEMKEKIIYIRADKNETIEIIDFAGGISDTICEKIFMPYFTTKEQGQGTGLGLYMSKRIMQEHFKGDLLYEKLENGSKFILGFDTKALKQGVYDDNRR